MPYITVYDTDVSPGRDRVVDLVRRRTPGNETAFLFDLRWHFRKRYLDEEVFEEHLRAAAAITGTDALAEEFALLLLTTMAPGWDLDDRALSRSRCYWHKGSQSALLAHAIEHPHDWSPAGGGLVSVPDRNRLERVELRERGGRLVIVAFDADRGYGGEYVPLRNMAHRLSPGDLFRVLFSMLPAIAEHMTAEPDTMGDPDWGVWGSEEAYAAVIDLAYTSHDAPHRKTLRLWKDGAKGTIDAAVACAKQDTGANLNERS